MTKTLPKLTRKEASMLGIMATAWGDRQGPSGFVDAAERKAVRALHGRKLAKIMSEERKQFGKRSLLEIEAQITPAGKLALAAHGAPRSKYDTEQAELVKALNKNEGLIQGQLSHLGRPDSFKMKYRANDDGSVGYYSTGPDPIKPGSLRMPSARRYLKKQEGKLSELKAVPSHRFTPKNKTPAKKPAKPKAAKAPKAPKFKKLTASQRRILSMLAISKATGGGGGGGYFYDTTEKTTVRALCRLKMALSTCEKLGKLSNAPGAIHATLTKLGEATLRADATFIKEGDDYRATGIEGPDFNPRPKPQPKPKAKKKPAKPAGVSAADYDQALHSLQYSVDNMSATSGPDEFKRAKESVSKRSKELSQLTLARKSEDRTKHAASLQRRAKTIASLIYKAPTGQHETFQTLATKELERHHKPKKAPPALKLLTNVHHAKQGLMLVKKPPSQARSSTTKSTTNPVESSYSRKPQISKKVHRIAPRATVQKQAVHLLETMKPARVRELLGGERKRMVLIKREGVKLVRSDAKAAKATTRERAKARREKILRMWSRNREAELARITATATARRSAIIATYERGITRQKALKAAMRDEKQARAHHKKGHRTPAQVKVAFRRQERREETIDRLRQEVSAVARHLLPYFEKVKSRIKRKKNMSLAESFFHDAHEAPEAVMLARESAADQEIAALLEQGEPKWMRQGQKIQTMICKRATKAAKKGEVFQLKQSELSALNKLGIGAGELMDECYNQQIPRRRIVSQRLAAAPF